MLTMYEQITIKTLAGQGEKKTDIARRLGCHRNTIYNVLGRDRVIEKQTREKPSCFDPYREQIGEWLDQKITRVRIHEMLVEEYGIRRSYDNLCKYVRKHFPKQPTAYGVQVVEPGEVAEIDFGYLGLLPDREGKRVKTWGLSVVLGYSRLSYCAIVEDQKLETLTKELTNAFHEFGGVPRFLKVDNMKTAIQKNLHYELEYNQDFLEFAAHYGTAVLPCAPYHPEQKGKAEAAIKFLKGNFLGGRRFVDGADLKTQLKAWVEKVNHRDHGTTKKVPEEVFKIEEQARLRPLPAESFSFFNRAIRKVGRNCHIHFENNYYSVPAILVDKQVTVRYNDSIVRMIYRGEQVALHRRVRGSGKYSTVRSHLPDYKVYSQTEYRARYEKKMADIGPNAHRYFCLLIEKRPDYWGRTVRAILGLSEEYGREAVERSLERALYFDVDNLATIRNILDRRLYEQEPEPRLPVAGQSRLGRDMSYYRV